MIVDAPRTDAWGRPLHGTEPQPFGFTGELQDPTTDLVYLRARWYNPTSGTFLSRDPFAGYPNQPYSLHPYQYAYSQPTTLMDRSGERVDDQAVADPRNADGVLTSALSYMHNMRDLRAAFDDPERRLLTWRDLHPHIARTFVPNAEDPYQQQAVTSFYHTFQWGDPDPYGVLTLIELTRGRWCLTYGGCADDDGLFVRGAGGVGQNDESCVAGGFGSGVGSAAAWMTLTRKFAPDMGGGKGGGIGSGHFPLLPVERVDNLVQRLRNGEDIFVASYQQARQLLDSMPDLAPYTGATDAPARPGTYRGDVRARHSVDSEGWGTWSNDIHPPNAAPDPHRSYPHYNLYFHDRTKATILISP